MRRMCMSTPHHAVQLLSPSPPLSCTHQGMGRAAVSCEGSCKCKRFELDAHRVAKVCVCLGGGGGR